MLAHALKAAQQGFHIFPLKPGCKEPHPGIGKTWGPLPTTSIPQIVAWWTKWPAANIAIACKPSGILVIDCDPPKQPGQPDGTEEYIQTVNQHHGTQHSLWDTRIIRSPRGGLHFYYQWPQHLKAQGTKLHGCLNVDIRCNGGQDGNYVLAPGSVSAQHGPYSTEHDRTPAPCPSWLGQLVSHPPQPAPRRISPQHISQAPQPHTGQTSGLMSWLAGQQPGNQDNALAWAVRCLRDEGTPPHQAAVDLWHIVSQWPLAGPPWTERDIERHIKSAYNKT